MAEIENEIDRDEPLDPAIENVRRKMMRLMAVSVGVMFISIFAVLIAIVFKLKNTGPSGPLAATIDMPKGFLIDETSISDGTILLRGRTAEGEAQIFLLDALDGSLRGTIKLQSAGE